MKKIILAVGAMLLLLLLRGREPAHTQAQGQDVNKLMAAKLQNSQKVLEGIAIGDFKQVAASAEVLIQLTKTEEWLMHNKSPRYEMHSNEFQRAAETLIRKAKDKNMDGATLAFFELTMTCVRCHQYVREIRDARLPNSPLDGIRFTAANWKSEHHQP